MLAIGVVTAALAIASPPSHAGPAAAGPGPGIDASPPRWGYNVSVNVFAWKLEHSSIEDGIGEFQRQNRISDGFNPLGFVVGLQRRAHRVELEFFVARNDLDDFLDEDHYFFVEQNSVLFWYRREVPISRGRVRARVLPGVGVSYTEAVATIGCDASDCKYYDENNVEKNFESDLLEASDVAFALGVRFELELFDWGSAYASRHSFDLGIDYSYRFPDMPAETANEGDIFFPTAPEFAVTGHYLAIGLQYRFTKW